MNTKIQTGLLFPIIPCLNMREVHLSFFQSNENGMFSSRIIDDKSRSILNLNGLYERKYFF